MTIRPKADFRSVTSFLIMLTSFRLWHWDIHSKLSGYIWRTCCRRKGPVELGKGDVPSR